MGTGIAAVVSAGSVGAIQEHLTRHGCESYLIGEIVASTEEGKIGFKGSLHW
jgi:phosphoribosylaminoimidazole (AIR) synthetase